MRHPQFNALNEDDFEFLCDELASHEPRIVSTDLKRGRGVEQYGVDVEAFDYQSASEVGSGANLVQQAVNPE